MKNELLTTMSMDMGISRFKGESETSFTYRLLYSALGQWCLTVAQNSLDGISGTTKHNQIANYGRSILIGNTALFFGIPNMAYNINGLGVFSRPTLYKITKKEFLIRDDLTCEEYFRSQYDPIDFYDRDIDLSKLDFFNPQMNNAPSQSWGKRLETDCTVAQDTKTGSFFRMMKVDDILQFPDEPLEQQNDSFTSYEYRRLYFAMKAHYGKPVKATITKYDEVYSKIRLGGHLPNREYYFMLLLSWPENNAFDKANFIIRNDFLNEVTAVLTNIGIEIKGGHANG